MSGWPKTDRIPPNQLIFFWAFELEALEDKFGYVYGDPVNAMVVKAFEEVLQIGLGDIEHTDLMIFGGDVDKHYVIGASGIADTIVFSFINKKFRDVSGFSLLDFATIPQFPLVPIFRFHGGDVIVYSDDSMSGKVIRDDGSYYGTSLELIYMEADVLKFP
jgi:hypothetical protein